MEDEKIRAMVNKAMTKIIEDIDMSSCDIFVDLIKSALAKQWEEKQMGIDREMTLQEYIGQLPEHHTARREYVLLSSDRDKSTPEGYDRLMKSVVKKLNSPALDLAAMLVELAENIIKPLQGDSMVWTVKEIMDECGTTYLSLVCKRWVTVDKGEARERSPLAAVEAALKPEEANDD